VILATCVQVSCTQVALYTVYPVIQVHCIQPGSQVDPVTVPPLPIYLAAPPPPIPQPHGLTHIYLGKARHAAGGGWVLVQIYLLSQSWVRPSRVLLTLYLPIPMGSLLRLLANPNGLLPIYLLLASTLAIV